MDAEKAAEMIVKSDLFKFLARSHEGNPPYYFRVELKCKMDHSKKSAFTRRLSSKIEKLSGRKLINTTIQLRVRDTGLSKTKREAAMC